MSRIRNRNKKRIEWNFVKRIGIEEEKCFLMLEGKKGRDWLVKDLLKLKKIWIVWNGKIDVLEILV